MPLNTISKKLYGYIPDGNEVIEYTLANHQGLEMKGLDYGCTITSLKVPDRDGHFDDIVLGFDSLEGYLASTHYMGSVIGRYANRIAKGSLMLDGHNYSLAKNLYPNHLHGGNRGFDKVIWISEEFQNENGVGVDFHYQSPDADEGYPGNLIVHIRYFLSHANALIINYLATTDKKTIINLTQHSYFNLNGGSSNVLNHALMIGANHFLPVDSSMIPTGEIKHVEGSPFDFRTSKVISRDISVDDIQLQIAHGYDHNWVLSKMGEELRHAATLHDPASGRVLEVHTTEPGIQLYTGNFIDDLVIGKNNTPYGPNAGLCLETQHFPDSTNHPEFPSVELNPGDQYQSSTIWKFSTK